MSRIEEMSRQVHAVEKGAPEPTYMSDTIVKQLREWRVNNTTIEHTHNIYDNAAARIEDLEELALALNTRDNMLLKMITELQAEVKFLKNNHASDWR
jgi:hypothetical protein